MYYIDMHCHIVPGVDDGSPSIEESLKMLQMEHDDGVRTIIMTPHFRRGMFETPDEVIIRQFNKLFDAASEKFPDMDLYLGREFHAYTDMMPDFTEHRKQVVTMGGSSYVLLEFNADKSLHYIKARCIALLDDGFQPIVAHIERYPNVVNKPEFVKELVRQGVKIQVNASALIGDDGWRLKNFCKLLLKEGLIDFVGTDSHSTKKRVPNLGKAVKYVKRKAGEDAVERIFYENPMRIIDDIPEDDE
ncbi:MAG: capsular biosynthesis protein [Lachnospiraceae bacterium]|nr:capsular biosynthesis protein [Lachnospiraceae bacterium]